MAVLDLSFSSRGVCDRATAQNPRGCQTRTNVGARSGRDEIGAQRETETGTEGILGRANIVLDSRGSQEGGRVWEMAFCEANGQTGGDGR